MRIPKIRDLDPEKKEDSDFKTMQMSIVSLSVELIKKHKAGNLDGLVKAWSRQLAQGGLQGHSMTLKPAGEFDIIFRYATDAEMITACEFVMRQPETESIMWKVWAW